jgi:hypothetical protein
MPSCKKPGCGAAFIWGLKRGMKPKEPGAFIALEPEESPHGLYAIVDGRVVPADEAPKDAPRHVPHAVFCEGNVKPRRSPLSSEP